MSIENEMAICESTNGMECVTHHVDLLNKEASTLILTGVMIL